MKALCKQITPMMFSTVHICQDFQKGVHSVTIIVALKLSVKCMVLHFLVLNKLDWWTSEQCKPTTTPSSFYGWFFLGWGGRFHDEAGCRGRTEEEVASFIQVSAGSFFITLDGGGGHFSPKITLIRI